MANLMPDVRQRFFDTNGDPLVGGKLYTYAAGTTTPQATYTDQSGGSANTNPVVLDANGEANVWLAGLTYKFVLKDSSDVIQWTVDNVSIDTSSVDPTIYTHGVVDVATIKAIASANRTEALTIFVESLNAFFYFNPSSSAAGNDVTVIQPTSGTGRWLLVGGSTGTNTGDVTLTAVGSAPAAAGASLSGQALTLQPADDTHPGLLTILAQSIAGAKTFFSDVVFRIGQATSQASFSNFALNMFGGNFVNFKDNTNTHMVGICAPTSVSADYDIFLPTAQGAANTVPVNDGSGNLSFSRVSNAILATMATAQFKGRTTAGTGNVEDLTATQATAILNAMVGDSGSGGTKGLVPAAGSGDTAAGKFLKADGTFAVPAGTGITALTSDVTASGTGSVAATIANDAVTNAKMANMATATFKGRTTAGTGDPEDLTVTQATALLNAVVGDSGSGGTKGLVPAPGSGDAAALKFLKADGTWQVPSSSGGGGGSLQFIEDDSSPVTSIDNNIRVYAFVAALTQNLYCIVKVPNGYNAGSPIKMRVPFYSPDSSGNVLLQTVATLIRTGTDVMSTTTNQRTSTNSAVTLGAGTVSIPQAVIFDLSSSSGQINGISIAAGDLISVKMIRGTDTATSDVKVPVYSAEVTFT